MPSRSSPPSRGRTTTPPSPSRTSLPSQNRTTTTSTTLSRKPLPPAVSLPNLVAVCLAQGDSLALTYMMDIVVSLFTSLLGNCVLPEDKAIMMRMLHKLVEIQLAKAANPKKLLRHGTSSFSRLYKSFSDQLFFSRLFLTSVLYEPILSLLTDDEILTLTLPSSDQPSAPRLVQAV